MEWGGVCVGLLALVWPVIYLSRRVKGGKKKVWVPLVGLGCCGFCLWDQLLFQAHLAAEQNVSAWQDTADAVVLISGFLLVVALFASAAVLWADRKLEQEQDDGGANPN